MSELTQIDALQPLVIPEVVGVTVNMARDAIRRTVREVCRKHNLWREAIDGIAPDPDTNIYTLTPSTTGSSIFRIIKWWVLEPEDASIDYDEDIEHDGELDSLTLDPSVTPNTVTVLSDGYPYDITNLDSPTTITLSFTVSLIPALTGTLMPQWIADRWGEAIAYGALAKLFAMSRRPWTDDGRSRYFLAQYNNGTAEAVRDLDHMEYKQNARTFTP